MKILYLTPGCFDKGGISRYNRYQITACREIFGNENVKVISLLGHSDNDFEDDFKVDWHGRGADLRSKIGLIKKLMTFSIQWKPDLILCAHVNLSGISFMASRICGAMTVMNAYGLEIWSPLSRDASWGIKKVNYIISDCHNTAEWLIDHNVNKTENIEVIWDCIDLNKFYPDKTEVQVLERYQIPDPASHFNILSLGRLSLPDAVYKGYGRLIKSFAAVASNHETARLIIAGRGNYTSHLKELSSGLGVSDKIVFTGSVREEDLSGVYNSCHIFSLITESGEGKGEGIPLTPLEAMACGKPVMVGNQDGSREAIIDNNGTLLDPENMKDQEDAIISYIEKRDRLEQQSKNAVSAARKYFSYDHFKTKHKVFFDRIKSERK